MLNFSAELEKIWNDRLSGSGEILKKYIDLLKIFADLRENSTASSLKSAHTEKESMLNLLFQSGEHHKSFLVVRHFLNELIRFFESDPNDWKGGLRNLIVDYENTWNNVNEKIAAAANKVIDLSGKSILLHSNSSAVKSLFAAQKTHALEITVIQTESRPLMEGKIQAESLTGSGYKVRLIADAAIGRYAGTLDMAVIGADGIYNKYFVNKCGSFLIAMMCRDQGIPLYVLADSRKIWPLPAGTETGSERNGPDFYEEAKPSRELWENPPENVVVENYYFEQIPNELVTSFITEQGIRRNVKA